MRRMTGPKLPRTRRTPHPKNPPSGDSNSCDGAVTRRESGPGTGEVTESLVSHPHVQNSGSPIAENVLSLGPDACKQLLGKSHGGRNGDHQNGNYCLTDHDGNELVPSEVHEVSPDALSGYTDDDEVDMAASRPMTSSLMSTPCSGRSQAVFTVELDDLSNQNGGLKEKNRKIKMAMERPQDRISHQLDETDYVPEEPAPSVFDLLGNLVGIGSYLFDVGSDCWVACTHYISKQWWWFGLTLGFVIGPSLVMTFFSTVWYIQEYRHPHGDLTVSATKQKVSAKRWVSRFLFLFFQISPVLRYLDSIIFCCKSWKADKHHERKHWYERMLFEDTDATLLRLIECFMEAAPQLVLQLYIISCSGLHPLWYMAAAQVLSCVTSLFSLSWAIAAYHKALRLSLDDKGNMTWTGFILQLLWRTFTISARISAMALFASEVHPGVFASAIGLHWLVMFIWCLTKSTSFCLHRWQEPFFNAVMSVVYIFGFLNLLEGRTRFRYLFYYTLIYLENLGMLMVWFTMGGTDMQWFHKGAMVLVLFGFFVGIALQLVYYRFHHPNNSPPWSELRPIRCCLTWAEVCNHEQSVDVESAETQPVDLTRQRNGGTPQLITRGRLHANDIAHL